MTEPATHQASTAALRPSYLERLRTPWWWYPVGVFVGILLGAEFAFIVPLWLTWLPIVVSLLVSVLVVWRMSSATVRVVGREIVAGDRALPVDEVVEAIDLTETEVRRVVGRHGDPLAYNFIRSWVGPGVQLVLREDELTPDVSISQPVTGGPAGTDYSDPDAEFDLPRLREPYWLLSSRHPREFIAAIEAARH